MYGVLKSVALRIGLGIIIALLLLMFTVMLETIFYKNKKDIHLAVIFILMALIIYALGDIAVDMLNF